MGQGARRPPPPRTEALPLEKHSRGARAGSPLGTHRVRLCESKRDTLAVVGHGGRLSESESNFATRTAANFEVSRRLRTFAVLDWLNKGVFISVGSRRPGIVIYEAYLVA